jgi:hypothetical protein
MNVFLDVLQIGDDGEDHDDKKRPGTPFSDVDCRPGAELIWVTDPHTGQACSAVSAP